VSQDPYGVVANKLEIAIKAKFPGVPVFHDKLHESIGYKGARIGISAGDQGAQSGNLLVLDTEVLIQYYGQFALKVDPDQRVDPRVVTAKAHLLREFLQAGVSDATDAHWFFLVTGTKYPEDPTGNQTRFEMTVRAKGWNSGIVETSA